MKRILVTLMAISMMLFLLTQNTFAKDEPILLKYATVWPPMHPFSIADKHYMEKIEKETNNRVKFRAYWSGSLVSPREGFQDAIGGVADIVFASIAYEKAGFDFTQGQSGFYQGITDQETKLNIFWQQWEKYPELRDEFKGVRVLGLFAAPNARLATNKPVKSLADLEGMRLKAPFELIQPLKSLGVEGLIMPMTEVYESLSKGIVSGLWTSRELYKTLKLADVVQYEANLLSVLGPIPARLMPIQIWNKLPKDVQDVLDRNKEWWSLESAKEVEKADAIGFETAKKAGIEFVEMPKADVQRFDQLYEQELEKIAKKLDQKGLPGTAYYQDIRKAAMQFKAK